MSRPAPALLLCVVAGAGSLRAQGGEYRPLPEEQAFLDLMNGDANLLEAREKARAYLALHPDSFAASLAMGVVYLRAEGDMPRSEYYLRRARTLLERAYAEPWHPKGPWRLYAWCLAALGDVYFRMDRHREALSVFEAREMHFIPRWPAQHAWAYMKLGDPIRARAKIAEALASNLPEEVENGLNTLGALEGESDHPDEAYAASLRLDAMTRQPGHQLNSVFLANHAEHAMRLGRLQEAERFYLESSEHFSAWRVTNPWQDLAQLYLREQRIPEALDAVRRMQSWAYRSHPLVGHDNWNRRQTITADLLLQCGYTDEALDLGRRMAALPDRHGMGSADAELWAAGSLLFHHQALLDALRRDEEALSFAPWKARPGLWMQRLQHGLEAASARRRAARALMARPEWLRDGLRALAPKDPVLGTGGEILLPEIVGAGVAEGELRRLLARAGSAADRERGFLWLYLAAARVERGDTTGALGALDQADVALPPEWAAERTQLEALRAKAHARRGEAASALRSLRAVMGRDPGAVRRFGLSLPCRIQASGGTLANQAAGLLEGSPRLDPGRGGFRVVVTQWGGGGLSGGLDGPEGEVLSRFQVPPGKDGDATVRAFCQLFHRKAFGPRVDLSQQQINSLRGSTLAGEDVHEQLKGVLDASAATGP